MKKYIISATGILFLILSCISLYAAGPRVVRIGAFNYYPAIFQDKDGVVKGFYVDALADLAQRENIRFDYVYGSWSEGLERLKSGEVDVLTSVAFTPERAEYMDYTATPLLTVWGELYAPLASEIDGIREVQGKKIAVMKGDFNARHFIDLMKKFDITCVIIELPGFDDVFKAVASKKVGAGVVNSSFGVAKQEEYGLRSTGVVFNPFDIFFTVAKGKNQSLLTLLENNLANWRHQADSPYNKARQKWSHSNNVPVQVIPSWLGYSIAILAMMTLVAVAFIVVLKRQVRRKTRSVVESAEQYQLLSARQNAILAAVPDIIMEVDSQWVYTWSNSAGFAFFGDDVIGKEAGSYFAATQHTYEIVQPLLEGTEKTLYIESWQRRKDGEVRLLAWWCKALEDEHGSVTGSLSTARDITERKQAENTLKESEERHRTILRTAMDGIWLADTRGRLIEVNDSYCRMSGYNMQELLSMSIPDVDVDDTSARKEGIMTRGEKRYETRHRRKDGTFFEVEVSVQQRPDEGQCLAFLRDISDRKQFEKVLQDKNAELEGFTYTVSHDLKSPLVTIQAYAGMIRQDMETGKLARAQVDLTRIEDAAAKMSDLLNDLLELSRVGRIMNAPSRIDMNRLVKEVMTQLAGLLGRKIEMIICQDLPETHGDQKRIAEVIQNLVENAIKYMGDQAAPRIEIGTRQDGKECVLFVKDNGKGIDLQFHENIFSLFNKLDAKSEGTGIGLALVKRIVEVHGGRVWVESEGAGMGSTFCISLPGVG